MSAAARAVCGLALLAALFATRGWMEASMLRHMLLQLPLLVLCGALLQARAPARLRQFGAGLDLQGLTSFTALAFVSTYWMVPRALEQALFAPAAEAAKWISLLLVGACLPGALARAHLVVQLFFVANLCAMMAIAGLLYQELPQRLCNAYLLDDQAATGAGLVGLALALAAAWCVANGRRFLDAAPQARAGA